MHEFQKDVGYIPVCVTARGCTGLRERLWICPCVLLQEDAWVWERGWEYDHWTKREKGWTFYRVCNSTWMHGFGRVVEDMTVDRRERRGGSNAVWHLIDGKVEFNAGKKNMARCVVGLTWAFGSWWKLFFRWVIWIHIHFHCATPAMASRAGAAKSWPRGTGPAFGWSQNPVPGGSIAPKETCQI